MKHKHPLPLVPLASTLGTIASLISLAHATPVTMNGAGSYSQDFDTLPTLSTSPFTTWVNDSTLSGWYAEYESPVSPFVIRGDTGASATGSLFSYGAASVNERALGSVGSGTPDDIAYGVLLQNTGATTLTINSVSYRGEQWRNSGGTTAHPETATFSYKVSNTAITALDPAVDTTWTNVPALDFTSPLASGTAGAVDGNTNFVNVSGSPSITVPPGQYVMLRWRDIDHPGSTGDHGLAIDGLSVTWVVETQPAITVGAIPTSFAEDTGPAASAGTVSIPAALGADLVVTLASSDTTEATVPASVTITAGNTSAPFAIDAVNDFLTDGNQAVTITASAVGYVSGQVGLTVEEDEDTAIGVLVTPDTFSESAGANAATGTVELPSNAPADVVVNLFSNDTSEATVPATVTILAGTDSITFPVNAVNDTDEDGPKTFNVRATASGYTDGQTSITVTDDGDTAPPPTLDPGDIAFVGFNADGNDDLAFVALAPIAETDVIYFADKGWNGSPIGSGGAFGAGEGVITWTPPVGGIAQGAIVSLNSLSTAGRTASAGTVSATGSFALGAGGETVYAYQGSVTTATGFIAAITTTTDDSFENTGLSAPHIVTFESNIDVAAYTGSRSTQATYAGYLALIGNVDDNWETEDGTGDQHANATVPDVPFATTAFTLGTAGNYASWATTNGITGELPNDDFDKDGLSNLLEYAMGLDPKVESQPAGTLVNGLLSYPKGADAFANGDVTWKIQTSTTLAPGSWQDVTETENNTSISFQLTVPPPAPGKIFARLEVTQVTP